MLPHRVNLGSAVTPAPITDHLEVPALEAGHRAGKARDPHGSRKPGPVRTRATIRVPRGHTPAPAPQGTPEQPRHPVSGAAGGILRRWGWGEWDQVNTGQHGELVPRASVPQGEQTRYRGSRGNTFRLPPQPWDTHQVIGYTPEPGGT